MKDLKVTIRGISEEVYEKCFIPLKILNEKRGEDIVFPEDLDFSITDMPPEKRAELLGIIFSAQYQKQAQERKLNLN